MGLDKANLLLCAVVVIVDVVLDVVGVLIFDGKLFTD